MGKMIVGHEFYCCKCGMKGIPVVRQKGKEREPGHLKKLFCLTCNAEINHVECIAGSKYQYEDFLLEFSQGNFDSNFNRILPYGVFKDSLRKEGKI